MKMVVAGGLLLGCLAVVGCDQQKLGSVPDVVIETDSPDLAVKSWWKLLDADAESTKNLCESSYRASPLTSKLAKIATGETGDWLVNRQCSPELFSRAIDEVRVESDTRAMVMTSIKNVTPLGPEIQLTDKEVVRREAGEKFRYLLERESGSAGWKISQVYSFDGYSKEWTPQFIKFRATHQFVFRQ